MALHMLFYWSISEAGVDVCILGIDSKSSASDLSLGGLAGTVAVGGAAGAAAFPASDAADSGTLAGLATTVLAA